MKSLPSLFTSLFFRFSPIYLYQIEGRSMLPTFHPGETVLVLRRRFVFLHVGDIVVLRAPQEPRLLLKRISGLKENQWIVHGDNRKESTDSRQFGAVPDSLIVGKVICRV